MGIFGKKIQKCLLSSPLRFIRLVSKRSIWLVAGVAKRVNFRKKLKKILLRNSRVDEAVTKDTN